MLVEIKAPTLTDSDNPALLGAWTKKVGESIRKGETLVELEEQKTTYEIVAPEDGVLQEILQTEGAEISSESVLAVIDARSEEDTARIPAGSAEIRAPGLKEADSKAILGAWAKKVGDSIAAGETLAELEEEKVTYEITAHHAGVLLEILRHEGDEVSSEDVLAIVGLADGQTAEGSRPRGSMSQAPMAAGGAPAAISKASTYDVIVIGGGPGGYAAAIRCAQLGLKTACVDKRLNAAGKAALGGTCLNVGCIPSKALLDSSHRYHDLLHHAQDHGIGVDNPRIDVAAMMKRKIKVVDTLVGGIQSLFKKNGVTQYTGTGKLLDQRRVLVISAPGGRAEEIAAQYIIIATGSEVTTIPPARVDNDRIVDSTGAMAFDAVPERLGVIGAGAIGLEMGSVWRRLGSEVVVLEALDVFLGSVDAEIADEALKILRRQGLDIRLGAMLTEARVCENGLALSYTQNGDTHGLIVDKLIVAVGRRPHTTDLGAQDIGLIIDKRGFIEVDDHCRTNIDNIFAIGDVVRGPMLAHKSEREGVTVAELIAGHAVRPASKIIPGVIYTWPEVAWIGQGEQHLKAEGTRFRTGVFPFRASGRALAAGETEGRVKVLAEEETGRVLGVHIFGPQASELIAEAVAAMESGDTIEALTRAVHAHPSLSEVVHEAALAVHGSAVHV